MFVQAARGKVRLLVALPFAINILANLVFTPIQFGTQLRRRLIGHDVSM